MTKRLVKSHAELEVYQKGFDAVMTVFEASKRFLKEETYALTDQIRRSSRGVCANIAEAWRKRQYPGAFAVRISDAETEAAETQVWLQFAVECQCLTAEPARELYETYDQLIGALVRMRNQAPQWAPRPRDPGSDPSSPHLLTSSSSASK